MKTMFIPILGIVFTAFQESLPNLQSLKAPEQNRQHPIVPKRIPADSLPLNYRYPNNPEIRILPENRFKTDTFDSYNMPTIILREYRSHMPVMVPDTSVHYHLKIKMLKGEMPVFPMPIVPKK